MAMMMAIGGFPRDRRSGPMGFGIDWLLEDAYFPLVRQETHPGLAKADGISRFIDLLFATIKQIRSDSTDLRHIHIWMSDPRIRFTDDVISYFSETEGLDVADLPKRLGAIANTLVRLRRTGKIEPTERMVILDLLLAMMRHFPAEPHFGF
ncbi:MAG TPA: hypothetical protein VLE72_01860 [Candidatus Saccharimonadales bacterium]|nr:hypothetical protein [Candidatus Saccharimonadales bacterium]